MTKKRLKTDTSWGITVLLMVLAIVFICLPLYITIITALKSPTEMVHVLAWPKTLRWDNFSEAWNMVKYPQKFFNTFIITVFAVVFTLLTNSLVAYAIARNRAKSKFFNFMYYYFISAMFIPFAVLMLPLVKQANNLHIDNIAGITFLYIVFGLPMNTFLYSGYIKSLPNSLDEAAMIDGANPWQIFFRVIFPLLMPINATVAIFTFMWTWNDFLMPLVLLSKPNQQTLQLSQYVFQGQFSTNYNLAFASYLMALIPILLFYLFGQKWIIGGITKGAVK
jgi:raffinose/stachyose/melibiose transport system permease protein